MSSPEQMMIEKLLMKIPTKSKIINVPEHQYEIFIKSIANFSFGYNALQVLLLNGA